MIRFRGKAVGLGLALVAGPFAAAQSPALLPPTVRGSDWSAGAPADPVWFPARPAAPRVVAEPPAAPPTVTPVTPAPAPVPAPPVVRPAQADGEPVYLGPRSAAVSTGLGPLPAIPPLPDVAPVPQPYPVVAQPPVPPPVLPELPVARQPQPAPPPRAVEPAPMPPIPTPAPLPPPSTVPPSDAPPRPQPQPTPQPVPQPELQTAPAHLLVPHGYVVPGKHGTFGSPPVNISRDYPTLRELFQVNHPDGLGGGLVADGADGAAAPATDRGFVRAEYLLWWVNPQRIPVLATTSTNGGLGFLGDPGTAILLGPGRLGDRLRDGLRLRGGWWCDEDGHLGVDGSFFFLGQNSETVTFDSATTPTITRPFFALNDGGFEFGERVARPGFSTGVLRTVGESELFGFDLNLRHALCRTCGFRSEVFAGYRMLGLNETLTITEFIKAQPGNTTDPAGTQIVVQDQFRTRNRFHGGQVGYAAERNFGRVSLDGRVSVALGNTHQEVEVSGFQVRRRPGEAQMVFNNGGLLAAGPNLGTFSDDRFSVVPEVSLNLGYWLTPRAKVFVGYNALYWSNVARPGDQIDRNIDVTFIPNPPVDPRTGMVPAFSGQNRPAVPFRQDHLFVTGLQFGAEWRW